MAITKDQAEKLLQEYVKSESLLNHSRMVAEAMKGMAEKYNANVEKWYIAGLLHDFDYEKWPDKHPVVGKVILEKNDVADDIIEAIQAHAEYTNTPRDTKMAKVLFAVDELSGLMNAVALMRPNGFSDMKVKSVMKKFKNKNFAAKIDRSLITKGAEELGVELTELISDLIEIFKTR